MYTIEEAIEFVKGQDRDKYVVVEAECYDKLIKNYKEMKECLERIATAYYNAN